MLERRVVYFCENLCTMNVYKKLQNFHYKNFLLEKIIKYVMCIYIVYF